MSFYIKIWSRYTIGARFLNNIFAYLNRHWVRRERDEGQRKVFDIATLCLIRWKEELFYGLEYRLIGAVLKLIDKHRDGQVVENQNIRTVVLSCVALGLDEIFIKSTNIGLYKKYFETRFLEATEKYYAAESSKFLAAQGVVPYIKRAIARIHEEVGRVSLYLRPETESLLRKRTTQVLVIDHAAEIRGEFLTLLKSEQEADLKSMFTLLEFAPETLVPLQESFRTYVSEEGLAAIEKLVSESEEAAVNPQKYIDTLLQIYEKYARYVKNSFRNNPEMYRSLDSACSLYVNNNAVTNATNSQSAKARPTKTPEMLARYSDTLLRKSNKHTEVVDLDAALNKVMRILQFVDEKDVFEKTYTQTLARRLVNGTSISDDAETNMVTKLKDIRGSAYTNKLQRMFQDVVVSKEMCERFKNYLEYSNITPVGEFSPLIITDSYWPLPKYSGEFRVPDLLKPVVSKFEAYYTSQHNGRKLKWLWNFCKGELKANFSRKSKSPFTFLVSITQMAILLLFNEKTEYTFENLKETTLVDEEVLKGSLIPMVKARVLLVNEGMKDFTQNKLFESNSDQSSSGFESNKKQRPNSIGDESLIGIPGTKYSLNMDFTSKKVRINLNTALKGEQKRASSEVQKSVLNDRRMFLDACIVRIMKARKESTHLQLTQEVIAQASKRFKPAVSDIKKNIESLIEREYLERSDGNSYQYLA